MRGICQPVALLVLAVTALSIESLASSMIGLVLLAGLLSVAGVLVHIGNMGGKTRG